MICVKALLNLCGTFEFAFTWGGLVGAFGDREGKGRKGEGRRRM